jgi:gliding motility-associated-like protein
LSFKLKMKQTIINNLYPVLLLLMPLFSAAQVTVTLTVESGNVNTTCTDPVGSPDPAWRVNVNNQGWVTYPQVVICYQNPPFLQYTATYNCPSQLPATLNVCFRAFENDGFPCSINETCSETICQDFNIPAPGSNSSYTLSLPAGASSTGQVNFTVATSGSFNAAPNNLICNAIDLGVLGFTGNIGDSTLSQFNNYCADNAGDLNMLGAFSIEQGVWFKFTTGPNPSTINLLDLISDPQDLGDSINLEVAVYRSNDGSCNNSAMTLHKLAQDTTSNDVHTRIECLLPNTTYYIEVDGRNITNQEGYFGLEMNAMGIQPGADLICNAYDFGSIPDGGFLTTGMTQNNTCATHSGYPTATAFIIQQSVWFRFIAPTSGHVLVEGISQPAGSLDPVDIQLAVYRSFNNTCTGSLIQVKSQYSSGNFNETIELTCLEANKPYWILMDGSATDVDGNFELRVSDAGFLPPQSITILNDTICNGESIIVGNTTYAVTDTIFEILDAWNGCDSVVTGFLYVIPPIQTVIDTTVCFGEAIQVGSAIYNTTGPINETLVSWQGCDSLVTGNLIVLPQNMTTLHDTICFGESIIVGTHVYNSTGPILEILTDYRGCDSTVTGTLYVIPPITSTINETLCAGQSYTVGNQTYTTSGIFNVVLTSYQGCDSTVTLILNILPPLTATIVQTQIATDWGVADAIAVAQASGGTGTYTFAWSNGETTSQATGLTGGADYCVTITDNFGCIDTACFFTAFNVVFMIPATGDQLLCNGDSDGQLSFTTSNGPGPFFYVWQNEDNSINGNGSFPAAGDITNINGLPAGNYTITINNNWYNTQMTVAILEPEALLLTLGSQAEVSCVGLCNGLLSVIATGGTPAYNYSWDNGTTTPDNTDLCAGNYIVTLTDANGCLETAFFEVLEPALPVMVSVEITDSISCFGGNDGVLHAIATGGSGDYSYLWSNNDTTEYADGIVASFYLVTVTDGEGCVHSTSFSMPQPGEITFDYGTLDIDCKLNPSGSVFIENIGGGSPDYQVAIDGLIILQDTFAGLEAGIHDIVVTDRLGCIEETDFQIYDNSQINVNAGDDQMIQLGELATLTAYASSPNVTWNWSPADSLSCQDCQTTIANLIADQAYTITVIDTITGCSDADNLLVRVKKEREPFIPNVFSPNDDGINDVLMVFGRTGITQIRRFAVFDRYGEELFNLQNFPPDNPQYGWDGSFRGQKMTSGVFVWLAEIEYKDGFVQLFKGDVTLLGN